MASLGRRRRTSGQFLLDLNGRSTTEHPFSIRSYQRFEERSDSCRTIPMMLLHCNNSASPTANPQHNDILSCPLPGGRCKISPVYPVDESTFSVLPCKTLQNITYTIVISLPFIHLLLD